MFAMKRMTFILLLALMSGCDRTELFVWQPAPGPLATRWTAEVDPMMPWPEYPRPQMVREEWLNLNGLWDYQLLRNGENPDHQSGKILVPYPVESSLSGVADSVGPDDMIRYRREFPVPESWLGKEILLHFEAVDWQAEIYINGHKAGIHRGGYDPFTFNITGLIGEEVLNELVVLVSDPTDRGYQPRGKQVLDPHGIWYTPSSGIWQTVWIEPVGSAFIDQVLITPDLPGSKVVFIVDAHLPDSGYTLKIYNDSLGLMATGDPGEEIDLNVNDPRPWSPDDPFLYPVSIALLKGEEISDIVQTYFGMRSIGTCKDDRGFVRLCLNDEILFHNGPLDQGFWPDGLYTPPTDEAMKYDILTTKEMGFNMLRKHVKIENRRFYYWCDKLGIMVWQDMPSTSGYVAPDKPDLERNAAETEQFKCELERMILTKYNHPSIVMWVPFNEGWGQFDTRGIVDFIRTLDPSRLVNNTSGWADRGAGDVIDIHHYPDPRCPEPESTRASVLGEFGGLGLFVEGHTWEEKNWGYRKMGSADSLLMKYEQYYDTIRNMMVSKGLAASVYTQTTDVETETNGLMTYDRDLVKMDKDSLYRINGLYRKPVQVWVDNP